jgi:hypothetical protein
LAIATKKGFVDVFVINVTPIGPPAAEPAGAEPPAAEPAGAEPPAAEPAGAALLPVELQAAKRTAATTTATEPLIRLPKLDWFTWSSSDLAVVGVPDGAYDNDVSGL